MPSSGDGICCLPSLYEGGGGGKAGSSASDSLVCLPLASLCLIYNLLSNLVYHATSFITQPLLSCHLFYHATSLGKRSRGSAYSWSLRLSRPQPEDVGQVFFYQSWAHAPLFAPMRQWHHRKICANCLGPYGNRAHTKNVGEGGAKKLTQL